MVLSGSPPTVIGKNSQVDFQGSLAAHPPLTRSEGQARSQWQWMQRRLRCVFGCKIEWPSYTRRHGKDYRNSKLAALLCGAARVREPGMTRKPSWLLTLQNLPDAL